ncbi:MAG: glycosyltransferase [Solirubrobacteraceae bacterium]
MALRLTGTTLPSTPSTPTAQPAESLAAQARGALIRGDVDAYARLFSATEEHTDPQRRHQARLAVIDAGLSSTAQATTGVATRVFLTVADATLTMLEAEPSEPFLLNLAGVAIYELWGLDAAQALFRAAKRLDPGLADTERNLAEVGRRKRAGRPTRPLHAALPGLTRRARAVAERACPATSLTLSLCMIVRDEEQMLARCLQAAAPAVDEIVVVDTGSTDRTVEIARQFGARVIEHPWTGSFSDARNVSFEAATSDWIIYLDADEVLVDEDVQRLRELTGQTWREAFYLVETSYTGELGDGSAMVNNALRVFRNRPEYRFTGRLHEQISHTLPTYNPDRVEQSAVRITHYGYLGSVRAAKEKSQRNIDLLTRQAAESAPTPFLHFNLGSEYIVVGEHAKAIDHLQKAKAMLTADGTLTRCEYGPALTVRLVMVLRMAGRLQEARSVATETLQQLPDLTDLVLAQARIAGALGDADAAIALYRRAIEMGDAPAKYGAILGSGTFLPRLALAELHLQRGEPTAARELLEWCIAHHPEFVLVAAPYVAALLAEGVEPAEVALRLGSLGDLPHEIRTTVAGALEQAGARDAAEAQYRHVLDRTPQDGRTLTALAELLLGRGAWDEAAEYARQVPTGDPFATHASRIELCALTGRAPAADVQAALTRSEANGLSRAESEVFTAWAGLATGAAVTEPLPVAGAPLLGVILETLLRNADGDRFVAVLGLLERSRLERREQHELLAEMYLAHGLIDRAAAHWMEVCSAQPDARALIGLTRIALGHGMSEDAVNFATAALELDPGSATAAQLLARAHAQTAAVPA